VDTRSIDTHIDPTVYVLDGGPYECRWILMTYTDWLFKTMLYALCAYGWMSLIARIMT